MRGSDTTNGLSLNRSSANASGTTKTSLCKIAVEQSATSRDVSATEIPTRDLNHWRSPSISEINAIGVLQTKDASSVRSSNANSGSVSRMAYFSRAATRLSSFLGLVNSIGPPRLSRIDPGQGGGGKLNSIAEVYATASRTRAADNLCSISLFNDRLMHFYGGEI